MVLSMATGTAPASTSGGNGGATSPVTCEILKVALSSTGPATSGDTATAIASDCARGCAAASITGVEIVDICSSAGWLSVRFHRNVLSGIHHGVWMWTSQAIRRYA